MQCDAMRILCDVCEAAPARYFCAADEAALCPQCDGKVHGCNNLAGRHLRLELTEARKVPQCDICEISPAYFFCGVDGTSLCLQCDMDVHIGAKRMHERYIMMGQRVELLPISVKEEGAHHGPSQAQEMKHGQGASHHPLHIHQQKGKPKHSNDWNNSNAPALAIAVGEAELTNIQPSSLSSGPTNTQGQQGQPGQGGQDEPVYSGDGCVGVVPEFSSMNMEASNS